MVNMILAETPFFSIDLDTIIPMLINTLLLFLVLKHFLFKPVNKVLDERMNEVDETYSKANEAKDNALKLENEYSEKMAGVKAESAQILQSATARANSKSDEIINSAKEQAKGIVDRANAEIEVEKKRATNEIKSEITDLVFDVAQKVVDKNISTSDNEKMIEEFINNVGEIQ
ncbi:MAG: F0F1 ATP synthase subunit B [Ruminococcus sp.]|nr:F0F1 ATP synthase subunit B [Ruminococcus sp.]